MRYYVVDAFTDQPFGGNPAGVVLLESERFPEEKLMLQIAAELRYSETAFIRRHSDKEFTIRYFTPKAEVELCGHATIASFYLLHHCRVLWLLSKKRKKSIRHWASMITIPRCLYKLPTRAFPI